MTMNRILAGFLLAISFLFSAVQGADAKRPNIVLIMADDLGYSELGSYGQKLIQTPYLDALATQGMRFSRNYSGNAVCAPSRCVLMTGRHPGHAWIRNNGEVKPEGQRPIPDSEVTIGEVLQDAGYATGAFGKWGLGSPGSEGDPMHQGFDRFFGYNCQRHAHSYYPSYLWSNKKRIVLKNNPPVPGHASLLKDADPANPRSYDIFKGQDYAPDRINEQALDFIRENKNRPFFLYYPTVIPHVALHVPDEELKPYLAKQWNDPPFTRGKGYGYTPHFTPRAAYAAMITRMDRYIGRVLNLLKELQLEENTIVIFTSDNGTT
ncbi:MAG: sulfatase-like hydrolase/transferase, partial [Pirellulaceae bacterium]